MDLDLKLIETTLAGNICGHKLYYYNEIKSTNDEAFLLGNEGAIEGTAVIADSQTRGKGRIQRSWHSPSGVNIYTSIILRPEMESSKASQIPIMAGVAVAESLDNICPSKIKLKWPNDVLLNEKKVCGILSEAKIIREEIDFIVLGIGINVNMEYKQLLEEIKDIATSLFIETGRKISRQELVISVYENIGKWYKKLQQTGFDEIRQKWLELTQMIGQTVQIKFGNEMTEGKAIGLDEDGSLILYTQENKEIKVSAGDATILR